MGVAEVRQYVMAGRRPGRVTLGVQGALDGPKIEALQRAAATAIEPGMDLIVDLSEVTAIGPEGLAALTDVGVLARADGGFHMRPPPATAGMATELARLLHPAGKGG